jgi:hypothetical protein
MDAAGAAEHNLPIACMLGADDGPPRARRWRALAEKGRAIARRSGHRIEVHYQAEPGVREELEALVAAERQCCRFVAWDVREEGSQPVLYVTADPSAPDDVASITVLFEAD